MRITNGLIVDPWAMWYTAMYKRGWASSKLLELSHGEAKFKRAFKNCLAYADSMTVIGPLARLDFGAETSSGVWRAQHSSVHLEKMSRIMGTTHKDSVPDNVGDAVLNTADASQVIIPFLDRCRALSYDEIKNGDLLTIRDAIQGMTQMAHVTMYDLDMPMKETERLYHEVAHTGLPLLNAFAPSFGLMAVILTFKTMATAGRFDRGGANDMTAMSCFSPMMFLFPMAHMPDTAMLPFQDTTELDGSFLARQMLFRQPSLYHVTFISSPSSRTCAPTFGLPFRMDSVSMAGKTTDPFRLMAKSMERMFSSKAQYVAWVLAAEEEWTTHNVMESQNESMKLYFDPIATGRRVRNHNRGEFDLSLQSMVFAQGNIEDASNSEFMLWCNSSRELLANRTQGALTVLSPSWLEFDSKSFSMLAMQLGALVRSYTYGGGFFRGLHDILPHSSDSLFRHMAKHKFGYGIAEDYVRKSMLNLKASVVHGIDPGVFGVRATEEKYVDFESEGTKELAVAVADNLKVATNFELTDIFGSADTFKEKLKIVSSVKEGSVAEEKVLATDLFSSEDFI